MYNMAESNTLALFILFLIISGKATGEQNAMDVIQADQIRAMIIKGESVDFSNVIVEGKLDLSIQDRNNSGYVNSSINIRDSLFSDAVDLSRAIFRNAVSFEGTLFFRTGKFSANAIRKG